MLSPSNPCFISPLKPLLSFSVSLDACPQQQQVPPEAVQRAKLYSLRVKVMDFDGMMKKADFLGQMDMQLDVLEGENEIEGWYFLNSRTTFFNTGSSQQQVGSINAWKEEEE